MEENYILSDFNLLLRRKRDKVNLLFRYQTIYAITADKRGNAVIFDEALGFVTLDHSVNELLSYIYEGFNEITAGY